MKYIVLLAVLASMGCASQKKQDATTNKSTGGKMSLSSELKKLTCTKGKDVRLLEVTMAGKGCALNYTKAGKMTIVASSKANAKHCEQTETKIRSKLEKSQYQCN